MTEGQLQRIVRKQRKAILAKENVVAKQIANLYKVASVEVDKRIQTVEALIRNARELGVDVNPNWLSEQARWRSVKTQIEDQVQAFGGQAFQFIQDGIEVAVDAAKLDAVKLIGSFALVPSGALASLAGSFADESPVRQLFATFGQSAVQVAEETLFASLAIGDNPRKAARAMSDSIAGMTRDRAEGIARTEMLRAYRSGTHEVYRANADLVGGWRWLCAKNARTCASCLAMDGTEHPIEEEFASHVSCRCTTVPITDLTPPHPLTGEEWLRAQPEGVQMQILGKTQHQLWKDGTIQMSDMVHVVEDPVWGVSRSHKSLRQMVAEGTVKPDDVSQAFEKATGKVLTAKYEVYG